MDILPFSGLRVSVSSISGTAQWRKESVTIIESQEPMEENGEENEGDVESDGTDEEREKSDGQVLRRQVLILILKDRRCQVFVIFKLKTVKTRKKLQKYQ